MSQNHNPHDNGEEHPVSAKFGYPASLLAAFVSGHADNRCISIYFGFGEGDVVANYVALETYGLGLPAKHIPIEFPEQLWTTYQHKIGHAAYDPWVFVAEEGDAITLRSQYPSGLDNPQVPAGQRLKIVTLFPKEVKAGDEFIFSEVNRIWRPYKKIEFSDPFISPETVSSHDVKTPVS